MALHDFGCEHRVAGEGYLVVPTAKHSRRPGTNCVLHEEAGTSCLGGLKPLCHAQIGDCVSMAACY
jgi:hypothetical protein